MKDTDLDLDIVFMDEDGVVIQVNSVKARTKEPITCEGYQYVLEVNIDSGIKVGDELDGEEEELNDEEKEVVNRMLVLDGDGNV